MHMILASMGQRVKVSGKFRGSGFGFGAKRGFGALAFSSLASQKSVLR